LVLSSFAISTMPKSVPVAGLAATLAFFHSFPAFS
jgi:hypothetical protein